jgi:hypothetical protein
MVHMVIVLSGETLTIQGVGLWTFHLYRRSLP